MPESPLPETLTLRLKSGVPLTLQRIPPGSFVMGSRGYLPREEPRHRVAITRAFYLQVCPVSQEQFSVWTDRFGIEHTNGYTTNPAYPAENMDWFQAVAFCQWLSREFASSFPVGYRCGLPTEAEWEYACRAGTDTEYWLGDGVASLQCGGQELSAKYLLPRQVIAFRNLGRNPFGVYDIQGNINEWCDDGWDEHAYKKRIDGVCDPNVIVDEQDWLYHDRTARGGTWDYDAWWCRSAVRGFSGPFLQNSLVGFRVCLFSGAKRNSDHQDCPSTLPFRPAMSEIDVAGRLKCRAQV